MVYSLRHLLEGINTSIRFFLNSFTYHIWLRLVLHRDRPSLLEYACNCNNPRLAMSPAQPPRALLLDISEQHQSTLI